MGYKWCRPLLLATETSFVSSTLERGPMLPVIKFSPRREPPPPPPFPPQFQPVASGPLLATRVHPESSSVAALLLNCAWRFRRITACRILSDLAHSRSCGSATTKQRCGALVGNDHVFSAVLVFMLQHTRSSGRWLGGQALKEMMFLPDVALRLDLKAQGNNVLPNNWHLYLVCPFCGILDIVAPPVTAPG